MCVHESGGSEISGWALAGRQDGLAARLQLTPSSSHRVGGSPVPTVSIPERVGAIVPELEATGVPQAGQR